jgi:RNA polymerase sigma-70 factor (ECF subfamily)
MREEPFSDGEILDAVLSGHKDRYADIVIRYEKRIFALGMKFSRNAEDARDFAQEVFVRAYERLSTFRREASFSTWLFKVAYYYGISSLRSRKAADSLPENFDIVAKAAGPEAENLHREAAEALKQAMRDLPERYRICVDLYFTFGMTYEQVAGVTDIPAGTVKSHVFRAKRKLRKSLKGSAAEGYNEV